MTLFSLTSLTLSCPDVIVIKSDYQDSIIPDRCNFRFGVIFMEYVVNHA